MVEKAPDKQPIDRPYKDRSTVHGMSVVKYSEDDAQYLENLLAGLVKKESEDEEADNVLLNVQIITDVVADKPCNRTDLTLLLTSFYESPGYKPTLAQMAQGLEKMKPKVESSFDFANVSELIEKLGIATKKSEYLSDLIESANKIYDSFDGHSVSDAVNMINFYSSFSKTLESTSSLSETVARTFKITPPTHIGDAKRVIRSIEYLSNDKHPSAPRFIESLEKVMSVVAYENVSDVEEFGRILKKNKIGGSAREVSDIMKDVLVYLKDDDFVLSDVERLISFYNSKAPKSNTNGIEDMRRSSVKTLSYLRDKEMSVDTFIEAYEMAQDEIQSKASDRMKSKKSGIFFLPFELAEYTQIIRDYKVTISEKRTPLQVFNIVSKYIDNNEYKFVKL